MGKPDRKAIDSRRTQAAIHHITRGGGLADNTTIIPVAGKVGTYAVYIAPANTPSVTIQKDATSGNGLAVFFDPNGGLNNTNGLGTFPGLFVRGNRLSSGTPANQADGDTWYDTAAKRYVMREAGQQFGVSGVVTSSPTVSSVISNTVTETIFSNMTFSFPANWWTLGRLIRFTAWGRYLAGGVNSVTLRFYLGTVVLCDFGATVPAATATSKPWRFVGHMTPTVVGASGAFVGEGVLSYAFNGLNQMVNTNPTTAVASNATLACKLTAQWSAAAAADSIQCNGYMIENVG